MSWVQVPPEAVWSIECRGFKSHPRQFFTGSFFTALGVLCCFALFVCLTLLASFFLPSHLSFKNMQFHHKSKFKYAIAIEDKWLTSL